MFLASAAAVAGSAADHGANYCQHQDRLLVVVVAVVRNQMVQASLFALVAPVDLIRWFCPTV